MLTTPRTKIFLSNPSTAILLTVITLPRRAVISWIFIIEMFIKLIGLGCGSYWSDSWNCLDGTIVTMSIVEMVMTALFAGGGVKLSFLRMLRMLRVLRILRLMRKWRGLYKIISTFLRAIPAMANIVFLIILVRLPIPTHIQPAI